MGYARDGQQVVSVVVVHDQVGGQEVESLREDVWFFGYFGHR